MSHRLIPRAAGVLLLAAAGTGLAACSGGHSAHPTAASTSASVNAAAVWAQYAACARTHGAPDLPDPQIDAQGQANFGSGTTNYKQELSQSSVTSACNPILNQLPAQAQNNRISPADVAKLLQFAGCMRTHGVAEWPDPKSDGTFPLNGTPLRAEAKSARVLAGMNACTQYWDKAISVS